jgi:hypothetical protein
VIDGHWTGIQNGFSLSLSMTQTNADVTGVADIGGISGFAEGTITGTFAYPNVALKIDIPGAVPIDYTGTMSATDATISGKLNGSGFVNLQIDVKKKKN